MILEITRESITPNLSGNSRKILTEPKRKSFDIQFMSFDMCLYYLFLLHIVLVWMSLHLYYSKTSMNTYRLYLRTAVYLYH